MEEPLKPWSWPGLLATSLARGLLACVVCLGAWAAAPAAIGWKPTTVVTGSMMPRLHVGDVAVSRPLGQGKTPTVGSILLFDDPDHPGRLRLHRFVGPDADGRLITKGDANPDNDSSPVELAAIRGIGTLRIPYVGLPVVWIREGRWLNVGLTAGALALLMVVSTRGRRYGFPDPDEDDGPGGGDGPPPDPTSERDLPVDEPDPDDERSWEDVFGPPSAAGTGGRRPTPVGRAVLVFAALAGLLTASALPASAAFTDDTATAAAFGATPYFKCANAVAAGTPYLYYRMDQTSSTTTTATDSSGNNRTGTYGVLGKTANQTRACTRDTGVAMTFNGSSGYLSSPLYNSAPPNVFTVEVWFKTTTTRGGKLIGWGTQQTGASVSYDRHLYMTNAGKVVFGVYPNAVRTVTSADSLNDGAWHHVAGTLSSAGMRLYVDGNLVGSDPSTTSGQATGTGYWRIAYDNLDGWDSGPTSRFFAGTLDDAAVYLTALSADEIDAHYEAGV